MLIIFYFIYNLLIIFYFLVQETTFEDEGHEGDDIKAVIFGDNINEEDARPDQELSGKQKIEDTEIQPKEGLQDNNDLKESPHEAKQQHPHQEIGNNESECQQLTSKTAKAAEVVLAKIPEVVQLDKLRSNLARNPKSRYCINKFENHLAKVQVLVLRALRQLNVELKAWDSSFLAQNKRIANQNDYSSSKEAKDILHKRKVALKLLESWKITVHL